MENASMFGKIFKQVRGAVTLLLYALNTAWWCSLLFPVALLKLIVPFSIWRQGCNRVLHLIASAWISCNNLNQRLLGRVSCRVEGMPVLDRRGWYLVLANHQSWVDILVLQRIFNRRIPLLTFFLKRELIWVPILGLAWWALDFPFMKRYSKDLLARKPHLAGRDLEITRKACEKYRHLPVAVMNFAEGTRFSTGKQHRQTSPYRHLLRPKSGGAAFVLSAMGERMHRVLDVTIVYPPGPKSFWAFLCGEIRDVTVAIRSLPIGNELVGDYFSDPEFRGRFQDWINGLWDEKDRLIENLRPKLSTGDETA
jgi:1-acyl-sn-glycerol-3-phosphate acyltransferase